MNASGCSSDVVFWQKGDGDSGGVPLWEDISTFWGERWAVALPVGGRRFDVSRRGGSERELAAGSTRAESLPEYAAPRE
jgi:hypothetical protein